MRPPRVERGAAFSIHASFRCISDFDGYHEILKRGMCSDVCRLLNASMESKTDKLLIILQPAKMVFCWVEHHQDQQTRMILKDETNMV